MTTVPLWTPAVVRALKDVTPTVREFEIIPLNGPVLAHGPGAHLQMQVLIGQGGAARAQTRSYSLVGEPTAHAYRIAVKRMDDGRGGSLAMWHLGVGDRLSISTPQSHFPLDTSATGYLLVAGGIGITPLVLMAQRLGALHRKTGVPVRMLYGARSEAELAYLPLLQDALGDALTVFTGNAAVDFEGAIAALPVGAQVYTCGPVPMLEAVKRAWHSAQRPVADLRYETFGSSGKYPAQTFQLKVPRHGLDMAVTTGSTVLEALEAAGVACLSDCRRGECGLCVTDILDVQGEVDHRDVFLSEHEKQSNTRICICVSRAVGTLTLDTAYRPD